MRVRDPERRVRINDSQAELDGFGNQAASILVFAIALSDVSYATLMQVML